MVRRTRLSLNFTQLIWQTSTSMATPCNDSNPAHLTKAPRWPLSWLTGTQLRPAARSGAGPTRCAPCWAATSPGCSCPRSACAGACPALQPGCLAHLSRAASAGDEGSVSGLVTCHGREIHLVMRWPGMRMGKQADNVVLTASVPCDLPPHLAAGSSAARAAKAAPPPKGQLKMERPPLCL